MSLSIGVAAPAFAVEGFSFDRIGGANRYATASLIAEDFGDFDNAILVNGSPGNYADALTANYLSGKLDAPILLTRANKMPEDTQDAFDNNGPTNVTIVGGEDVVSAEQEAALKADGHTVTRIAGDNRYLTNAEVIEEGGDSNEVGLVATGTDFADALAGGPLSYNGHALGLSGAKTINDAVISALKDAGVESVYILGGADAVSPAVVAKLEANGITVNGRLAGDDRSETSTEVADFALENLGFDDTGVNVASGYVDGYGADALAGGPLTGQQDRPLLITKNVNNPGDLTSWLSGNSDTLEDGIIFGGPDAVSVAAEAEMTDAAQGDAPASNQEFAVSGPSGTTQAGKVLQYTVSGIDADTVDIALVNADDVSWDGDVVTFEGSNPGGTGNVFDAEGSAGSIDSDITVVDGSPVGSADSYVDEHAVDGDTVTFSVVTAGAGQDFVPVVFADTAPGSAGDDNNIQLNADSTPSEDFGVGGTVSVISPEAADGTEPDGLVEWVDAESNAFSNDTETFFYDSNDEFFVDGDEVTLAEFEEVLSEGDELTGGDYRSDSDDQSTFELSNIAPDMPGTPTQEAPSGDNAGKEGIQIRFDESDTASVESYNVYRTLATQPVIVGQDIECSDDISDYDVIGTVKDNDPTSGEFTYFDGTAEAPADSGDEDPAYCYAVSAVDESGDESDAAFANDYFVADEATEDDGAPEFDGATAYAGSEAGTDRVVVSYDEDIDADTVDADGSDYQVRVTRGSTTTNVTDQVTGATATDDDEVTIALSGNPIQPGDEVLVTAVEGDDEDTVGDADSPQQFQAEGDQVVDTSAEAVDTTAPTLENADATPQDESVADAADGEVDGTVDATDNVAVDSVTAELFDASDDTSLGSKSATNTSGDTYAVNFDGLDDGDYYIVFTATDAAGQEDEATTSDVTVAPGN